jgi:hypothetical protein
MNYRFTYEVKLLAGVCLASLPCLSASRAGVLLDDHFTLGNRTTQNLPNSSAWLVNSAATLTNAVGNMTGVVPATSSCMWMTYFMPPGNPSALNIGDTIKITMTFSNIGISLNGNTTAGFRLGLFNYAAGGTRVTADGFSTGGANGGNVQGYATIMNFGQTFGINNPISIRKRTTLDANLLGSTGEYTTLGSGGGVTGDAGFSNNVVYTMIYSVTRTDVDQVVVTNMFSGPNLNLEVDVTDNSGTCSNFDCFAIRPAGANASTTNIVVTEFKVEGPPGLLTPPIITSNPQDMSLTVSDFGIFSSAAAGSLPLGYQWYYTDSVVTNRLTGQTNQNLVLTNIQSSQAGQYFVVASNSQGSATSSLATLSVTTSAHTPRGVIVDDTFQNNPRGATVTDTTSDWLGSVDTTLSWTDPGSLLGMPQTNTSSLWIANFLDANAGAPIDLAVGDALRVTLAFYPTNVAPLNTGTLRVGVFDFYDGATLLFQDGNVSTPSWNGSGGGANVRGYMLTINFGAQFGDATPLGLYVRNNLTSAGLMSATADFASLGSGPGGLSNAPAFSDGTKYTLQLTVARVAATQMQVSAQITGGQLNNLSFGAGDATYFTHRFSAFALRPNRTTDSAGVFNFSEYKVEIIPATILPFRITGEQFTSPNQFVLTWQSVPGKAYYVESRPALNPSTWTTNAIVTGATGTTSWTNSSATLPSAFYRIAAP